MHRCNFIILDKDFEKNDVVKIIAKTGLKHFRWSLIISIIQTSKLYMDLYFQMMCLTPEIMINPKLYSPHASTSVTKYKKKIPFTPQIARAEVSKDYTTLYCFH